MLTLSVIGQVSRMVFNCCLTFWKGRAGKFSPQFSEGPPLVMMSLPQCGGVSRPKRGVTLLKTIETI